MNKAMVVLSGGQDSTIALYFAKKYYDEVYAVTFNYGQRHQREVEAARIIADMAEVKYHEVVSLPSVLMGDSPLTDKKTELEVYPDYATMQRIIRDRLELTYVPMRNALFLTIAMNRAYVFNADTVVTGVCQDDEANYPDCRRTFLNSFVYMVRLATQRDAFEIEAPLLHLTKARSIRLALELPGCMEALAYSHTCYTGEYPPCGQCHACVLRAHGFEEAGVKDPLVQRVLAESQYVRSE